METNVILTAEGPRLQGEVSQSIAEQTGLEVALIYGYTDNAKSTQPFLVVGDFVEPFNYNNTILNWIGTFHHGGYIVPTPYVKVKGHIGDRLDVRILDKGGTLVKVKKSMVILHFRSQ